MIGTLMGSYRVTGVLGSGGMGDVYRAEHTLIGRPAAIKVLNAAYAKDREVVNRFFNEARAATAIHHPGIVEVFDFGYLPDGNAYIVMEFLHGESLAARIASRGQLLETEAFAIARGIASALGAAHAAGIIHRDIKPDNVYLVPDPEAATGERVKLLDFGIAKLTDGAGGDWSQTRTGAVLGTPSYMSPEQCSGAGRVDARADLYSLGCVLFEMLAGRPPFVGHGAGEVIGAHQYLPAPQLRTFAPGASNDADQIVAWLLAKRPEERVQTTADLVRLLGARGGVKSTGSHHLIAVGTTGEIHATTTLGGAAAVARSLHARPRRWGRIAAATLLAGGGVVAAVALLGGGSGAAPAATTAAQPAAAPTGPDAGVVDAGVDAAAVLVDAGPDAPAADAAIDAAPTRPRPRPRPAPPPSGGLLEIP
ncbi:MAG: serine/threonine-protein kinase [Kofleriaceae bacterium]